MHRIPKLSTLPRRLPTILPGTLATTVADRPGNLAAKSTISGSRLLSQQYKRTRLSTHHNVKLGASRCHLTPLRASRLLRQVLVSATPQPSLRKNMPKESQAHLPSSQRSLAGLRRQHQRVSGTSSPRIKTTMMVLRHHVHSRTSTSGKRTARGEPTETITRLRHLALKANEQRGRSRRWCPLRRATQMLQLIRRTESRWTSNTHDLALPITINSSNKLNSSLPKAVSC